MSELSEMMRHVIEHPHDDLRRMLLAQKMRATNWEEDWDFRRMLADYIEKHISRDRLGAMWRGHIRDSDD